MESINKLVRCEDCEELRFKLSSTDKICYLCKTLRYKYNKHNITSLQCSKCKINKKVSCFRKRVNCGSIQNLMNSTYLICIKCSNHEKDNTIKRYFKKIYNRITRIIRNEHLNIPYYMRQRYLINKFNKYMFCELCHDQLTYKLTTQYRMSFLYPENLVIQLIDLNKGYRNDNIMFVCIKCMNINKCPGFFSKVDLHKILHNSFCKVKYDGVKKQVLFINNYMDSIDNNDKPYNQQNILSNQYYQFQIPSSPNQQQQNMDQILSSQQNVNINQDFAQNMNIPDLEQFEPNSDFILDQSITYIDQMQFDSFQELIIDSDFFSSI